MNERNIIINQGTNDDYLVICDHASNRIPSKYDNLGLNKETIDSHRAYDIGISDVANALSEKIKCPLIMTNFSRLLIDPNRGIDDPTLIPKLSENIKICGNLKTNFNDNCIERSERINLFYLPYHQAIERLISESIKKSKVPKIISMHSFTPIWKGKRRETDLGILWDKDDRLASIFLNSFKEINIGDNKPYNGRLMNDTLYKHGTLNGLPHILIEIRQDLLKTLKERSLWANKIYEVLKENKKEIKSFKIKKYGSNAI